VNPNRLGLVALLLLISSAISAQEAGKPTVVVEKGNQLRQLLRDVSKYPPELRRAAVIVAQHPKLLGRLYDATQDSPEAVTKLLATFPADAQ
jgi:hypothetical protein